MGFGHGPRKLPGKEKNGKGQSSNPSKRARAARVL